MQFITSYTPNPRSIRIWLGILLASRLIWLLLFTIMRDDQLDTARMANGLYLTTRDTPMYYEPIESIIQSGRYTSICRMPGLMPIYLPIRAFASVEMTKQIIIVFQYLLDAFACLLLSIIAARIYGSQKAFTYTAALISVSSFCVLRASFLLSESFCISFIIVSLYCLIVFLDNQQKRYLIGAGIFLCWAIFLRQVCVLIVPIYAVVLFVAAGYNFKKSFIQAFMLFLPLAVALGAWTARNQISHGRPIVFVAPLNECMTQITPSYAAIRSFIVVTGKDFQPWSIGDAAHWYTTQDPDRKLPLPYRADELTDVYTTDSLMALKEDYHHIQTLPYPSAAHDSMQRSIIERTQRYSDAYIKNYPFRYYVGNRIWFLTKLLFPTRIDDLPFPAFKSMNAVQKALKASSLLLLWIVSAMSLLAFIYHALFGEWKTLLWMMIPLSMIIFQGWLGYIEQRFLATSYPFMVVFAAGLIYRLTSRSSKPLSVQQH
jgi:hypothetical protein